MTLSVSLCHAFPGFSLDVAFDAPKGVTALFGRSGSGKTTVVNAVAGLLRPDAGRIVLDDRVLLDSAGGIFLPPHRRRLGYVFQEGRLFPHLTVRQNLRYGQWFASRGQRVDFDRVVELLGLTALLDRRPSHLSGGEKQRVAIGRALLSAPAMLLMDEPMAALDAARKAEILPWLERLRDETHLPILYVSHALTEVARLATTIAVLENGRVLRSGPVTAILADPDLAPALGIREAGALLTARIAAQEEDGLTRLESQAGPLWLPRIARPVGANVRIRIAAQDVMLARIRPEGISALNVLPVTIAALRADDGASALVQLSAGADRILARITRRSLTSLRLAEGDRLFAVIKSVSVADEAVGLTAP